MNVRQKRASLTPAGMDNLQYQEKDRFTLVFFGPSQHGKSTLAGKMLEEFGAIPSKVHNKLAAEFGEEHSWRTHFDQTPDEREEGHTKYTTYRQLYSGQYMYTIFVAPGKLKYKKQIGRVYSMADLPLLVISSQGTEFEDSIDEIQQHILFMYSQLSIVTPNSIPKLPIKVVFTKWEFEKGNDFNSKRFNFLKEETTKLIGNYFHVEDFLVISTFKKENNILFPMKLFQGQPEKTLLSILDNKSMPTTIGYRRDEMNQYFSDANYNLSLFFGHYKIGGIGNVFLFKQILGQCKSGHFFYFLVQEENNKIYIKESRSFSMERHHQSVATSIERDFYGTNNKVFSRPEIRGIRNCTFCINLPTESDLSIETYKWLRSKPYYIITNVTIYKHRLDSNIKRKDKSHVRVGARFVFISHGSQATVKVMNFKHLTNSSNENDNNQYRIMFHVESFIQLTTIPFLNRFVLMDHDNVYGIGSIDNLYYEEIIKIRAFKNAHLNTGSNLSILNDDIILYITNVFSRLFH